MWNLDTRGNNHIKLIKQVSERQTSFFLSFAAPRILYRCLKSYMYKRSESTYKTTWENSENEGREEQERVIQEDVMNTCLIYNAY